nr:cobalamin-dependent protein [Candidatus Njordarchaeota archaeon]
MEGLVNAIGDLDEETAARLVKEMLNKGEDPLKIVELCRKGLEVVGQRYEAMEYFLSQLVLAADIFQKIVETITPKMKQRKAEIRGKVVLGTVQGDIHDMGKNLVAILLRLNGFEVYDLGVDVSAKAFVDKVKATGARIVGLSGLLTIAWDSMKKTVEEFKNAGLRERVRIMIGGGTINDSVTKYVGADAYGKTTVEAVRLATGWGGK